MSSSQFIGLALAVLVALILVAVVILIGRGKRHGKLAVKPLPPPIRDNYALKWTFVQEHFADRPEVAVADADRLVMTLMNERGYPTGEYERRRADLPVEYARTLDNYRAAHGIYQRHSRSQASTEELRMAMAHYRALVEDLLSAGDGNGDGRARRRHGEA